MFSKTPNFFYHIRTSLKVSVLCSLILFIYQLFIRSGGDVLGKDLSLLRSAVIDLFPYIVFEELAKIFIVSTLTIIPIIAILLLSHKISKVDFKQKIYLIWLPSILGVFCLFMSDYLYLPGLYSPQFSPIFNKIAYKLSFTFNPDFFFSLGLAFFVVGNYGIINTAAQKLSKKNNIHAVLALLMLACSSDIKSNNNNKKQNVFLIAIDSLRSDQINKETMPFLFDLSNKPKASNFLDHHIGVPRTFPSWTEILTGSYAIENGIRHMFPQMDIRRELPNTLPKKLNKLGYHTEVISDFAGDIFPRFNSGFSKIYTPTLSFRDTIRLSIEQQFPFYFWIFKSDLLKSYFKAFFTNPAYTEPMKLIQQSKTGINSVKKPLFQTIFFSTAHFPYSSPYPYYKKFISKQYTGPNYFLKNPDLNGKASIGRDEKEHIWGLYKGSLRAIDDAIKSFFNNLEASKKLDNSIIIITADHGEELFEDTNFHGHGEHLKNSHVTTVPLIFYDSNSRDQNFRTSSITRSIDIAPTILDLLSGEKIGTGQSLKDQVINGTGLENNLSAYSETGIWFGTSGSQEFQKQRIYYPGISQLLSFDPGGSDDIVLNLKFEKAVVSSKHRALAQKQYKIIYTPTQTGPKYSLFNTENDPLHKNDLKDKYPLIFNSLKKKLKKIITSKERNYSFYEDIVL